MPQLITEQLTELFNYSKSTNQVSRHALEILKSMREEFTKLINENDALSKQRELLAVWVGGLIIALECEQQKRKYNVPLYPNNLVSEVKEEFLKTQHPHYHFKYSDINFIKLVGATALANLPHVFNSALFKIEAKRGGKRPEPVFPLLAKHTEKIDYLVKSCQSLYELQSKVHKVAEIYTKHTKSITFSLFHHHGQVGRNRVKQFEYQFNTIFSEQEAEINLTDYLANDKNGNTHPHSFRTMLLHSLVANNVNNLTLKQVAKNYDEFLLQFIANLSAPIEIKI